MAEGGYLPEGWKKEKGEGVGVLQTKWRVDMGRSTKTLARFS